MPKPTTNQPNPSNETFENTPYGYWILSSLSEAKQALLKDALKEDTPETQRHLELAARSVSLANEKGLGEQDWKTNPERLRAIALLTLSGSPTDAGSTPEVGVGTLSTGGLASLPENQG